jgi:hypothetical protein
MQRFVPFDCLSFKPTPPVMKRVFLALFLPLFFLSCSKHHSSGFFSGRYTEISPVKGRTTLDFINHLTVIFIVKTPGAADTERDTLAYESSNDEIKLWYPRFPTPNGYSFHFRIIDDSTIRMPDVFYVRIPEDMRPDSITFRK